MDMNLLHMQLQLLVRHDARMRNGRTQNLPGSLGAFAGAAAGPAAVGIAPADRRTGAAAVAGIDAAVVAVDAADIALAAEGTGAAAAARTGGAAAAAGTAAAVAHIGAAAAAAGMAVAAVGSCVDAVLAVAAEAGTAAAVDSGAAENSRSRKQRGAKAADRLLLYSKLHTILAQPLKLG